MTSRREAAEQIARYLVSGGKLPPWLVRFPSAEAERFYASAWQRWRNGDRSAVTREMLADPDLTWLWPHASAAVRQVLSQYTARCIPGVGGKIARDWERGGGTWVAQQGSVPSRAAAVVYPEAASVLENVARLVDAARGRREMPTADWADYCGISSKRFAPLLTEYAPRWGLTVRRRRAGHKATHLTEISREEIDRPDDCRLGRIDTEEVTAA